MHTEILLDRIRAGDDDARTELMAHIYDELRRAAHRRMGGERRNHTLQATELAHDVLVRVAEGLPRIRDGVHLRATLIRVMQNWLIDCARRRRTREAAVPYLITSISASGPPVDLIALAVELEKLRAEHPRAADVIAYRAYLGCTIAETAGYMGLSHGTVERDFRFARAYLYERLHPRA